MPTKRDVTTSTVSGVLGVSDFVNGRPENIFLRWSGTRSDVHRFPVSGTRTSVVKQCKRRVVDSGTLLGGTKESPFRGGRER